MKFTWGTGIALFYVLFVAALVFALVQSRKVDHSLVMEDYYQADIEYQSHYDKLANAKALPTNLVISQELEKQVVNFQFPSDLGAIEGNILFYRPSDKDLDFQVAIRTDQANRLEVPTNGLTPGLWKVKVDWKAQGRSFYTEEVITL